MGGFTNNPPLPTNDPLPAPDVPPVNAYSPTTVFNDQINAMKAHTDDLREISHSINPVEDLLIKLLLSLVQILGDIWIKLLEFLVPLQVNYNNALTALHKAELPIGVPAARDMIADELSIVLAALGTNTAVNYVIPGSDITAQGEQIFNSLIEPFTLAAATANPAEFGSGFKNQHYLLKKALALSLAEYTLDSMKNFVGFGWMKQIEPILGFIDRSINPSNVVRQSMEQAYSFLMKAPIQRDLNHLYPIKDLGVTALAKLYIRNAIDEQTYLNKCLDAGLDNANAQQLIIETAKLLSTSQIGHLLNHGYISHEDALQQLKWQGYPDWQANALLFLETHSRYFSIQERVGTAAVTAWKKQIIDQAQLEDLLTNLGYNQDEISLLEIEGKFVATATEQKSLTYGQVRQLFDANLVDIDYVINFLTLDGYSADDTRLQILLDFTKAEERAARNSLLISRIRVEEQAQLVLADQEAAKNQTDLANVRKALAAELDSYQKELGQLQALPGILQLLGISL
jgi:hypothetical protein